MQLPESSPEPSAPSGIFYTEMIFLSRLNEASPSWPQAIMIEGHGRPVVSDIHDPVRLWSSEYANGHVPARRASQWKTSAKVISNHFSADTLHHRYFLDWHSYILAIRWLDWAVKQPKILQDLQLPVSSPKPSVPSGISYTEMVFLSRMTDRNVLSVKNGCWVVSVIQNPVHLSSSAYADRHVPASTPLPWKILAKVTLNHFSTCYTTSLLFPRLLSILISIGWSPFCIQHSPACSQMASRVAQSQERQAHSASSESIPDVYWRIFSLFSH